MEKSAIIFLDYNETFDDICDEKGNVFFAALSRFCRHFNGNIQIITITSAMKYDDKLDFSIKYDLAFTLTYFPKFLREKFTYLIEGNNRYISKLIYKDNQIFYEDSRRLSIITGSKKDGVELALKTLDKEGKITTCVFAGNDENYDLAMLDAYVGNREKYLLLANRRVLKAPKYPVYKLSMQTVKSQYNYGKEILKNLPDAVSLPLIVKTAEKSFGIGKGLEVITSFLEEKEKER